jgi:hypothetical protein
VHLTGDLTMLRSAAFFASGLCICATGIAATPVWESTFDATADGVVDVSDNNLAKSIIGANNGGTQTITTQDSFAYAYTPDKAGREIVGGVSGTDAFSGLYKFSWSAVDEFATDPQQPQYEALGFLAASGVQTRPMMGSVLRHWKEGADYFVGLDLIFASVGATNTGYKAGPSIVGDGYTMSEQSLGVNLGSNMLGTNFQIAIGFEPIEKRLTAAMYSEAGDLIQSQTGIIAFNTDNEEGIIAPPFGTAQAELDGYHGTHLGWSDYTGYFGEGLTVWEVDSLAYFDTADGAFPGSVDLSGDLDGDGFVGIADLNIVLGNWNATVTPGDQLQGDTSGDGFVGIEDLNTVLGTWNNGTPPQSGSVVPEPASLALLTIGASVFTRRRRRRRRRRHMA